MQTNTNDDQIEIGFRTYFSVLLIITGVITVAIPIVGIPIIILGILTFKRPLATFDPGTGVLREYHLFGKWAGQKVDRVRFDGENIVRMLPNGREKKSDVMKVGKKDDLALVIKALETVRH